MPLLLALAAAGVSSLPMILLAVLAVVIFLAVLYWILTLAPPTAPYASKIVLIAAGFIALYAVLYLLGAV